MHDRRDDRFDRGRSRRDHHDGHRRHHHHGGHRRDRRNRDSDDRGHGPDTRFLQLEMSELLYSQAESVTRRAFRELLLEEAKARFRERFGDQIVGLAQLAVDELMRDVFASLDIEERIRHRQRENRGRQERLAGILGAGRGHGDEDCDPGEQGSNEADGEGGRGPGSDEEP